MLTNVPLNQAKYDASHSSQLQPSRFLLMETASFTTIILWSPKLFSKGPVNYHVIYVFIYLLLVIYLILFIWSFGVSLSSFFLCVNMN